MYPTALLPFLLWKIGLSLIQIDFYFTNSCSYDHSEHGLIWYWSLHFIFLVCCVNYFIKYLFVFGFHHIFRMPIQMLIEIMSINHVYDRLRINKGIISKISNGDKKSAALFWSARTTENYRFGPVKDHPWRIKRFESAVT